MAMLNLGGTNFKLARPTSRRRLIMDIVGHPRHGKTQLALTAPGPIGYLGLDPGQETVDKFLLGGPYHNGKVIAVSAYVVVVYPGETKEQTAVKANQEWLQIARDWEEGLKRFRTVIIDGAGEGYDLLRLARFGKLEQVPAEYYGPVKMEFRRPIRLAYSQDCNLILIHKLRQKYDEGTSSSGKRTSRATGEYERRGMPELGYEVQVETRVYKEDGDFHVEIVNSRQNTDCEGEVLSGPLCTFPMIASRVFPETEPSDWE